MNEPLVLLPAEYLTLMLDSGGTWGYLDVQHDPRERLLVISGVSKAERWHRGRQPGAWHDWHYLRSASITSRAGVWYSVDPDVHQIWRGAAARGAAIPTSEFRRHVTNGWRAPTRDRPALMVALSTDADGKPDATLWWVTHEQAAPGDLAVAGTSDQFDLLLALTSAWPVDALAGETVVLIGAGSIGSAAAESLAAYGVRRFVLVDPDRLLPHNFARHRVHPAQVGRLKVNALADRLRDRDRAVQVATHAVDVIDHADLVRGILSESTAMLVTSDGVASRRVANHLAARAGLLAVLACVLEDGSLGEVLRVRPRRTGCLLCSRAELQQQGLDPEPALDLGYGTGTAHLPITAVGGDLGLVGELAAKTLVATLLERHGHRDQALRDDYAILGLKDVHVAAPFDVPLGAVRWRPGPPRRADCPSCGEA